MGVAVGTGLFSGLNIDDIISQLVAIDRVPIDNLKFKEQTVQARISSYANIKSNVSSFKTALADLKSDKIIPLQSSSSHELLLSTSVKSTATVASHTVVISKLATLQSLYSSAYTALTDEVADLSSQGTQKIKIQVGSAAAVTITINGTNNTLEKVRDAINNTANVGLTASTINDGTNYRLVLTSKTTGASDRIVITVDEDNDGIYEEAGAEQDTVGLSDLAFNPASYDANGIPSGGIQSLVQSQAAIDAALVVDGLSITRGKNEIDDILTGVTMNLLDADPTKTITLDVSKNSGKITESVTGFINAYNGVVGLARSVSIPVNGKAVLMTADQTAKGLISSLRSAITTAFKGKTPASLGLSHSKEAVLSLDSKILEEEIETDLQAVIDSFDAMADSLETIADAYIDTLIPARTEGLNNQIDRIQDRIVQMERRAQLVEGNLRKQFATLEQTLSQIQNSGSFLSQQLDSINAIQGFVLR